MQFPRRIYSTTGFASTSYARLLWLKAAMTEAEKAYDVNHPSSYTDLQLEAIPLHSRASASTAHPVRNAAAPTVE